MNNQILYCHPWVGEFGWELCWWNPMVRHYAKQCGYTIVAAPESSRYLYEFADKFIPLQTCGTTYWEGKLNGDPPVVQADFYLDPQTEFVRHKDEPDRVSTKRSWRLLSPKHPIYQADILCAFRPQKRINGRAIPGKEYPISRCQILVDMLISNGLSVACFGGVDNYYIEGTVDLRGQSLEEQCSAIAAAKCVVGPSSGPVHLASLCECPHVTWIASVHHTLEKRYRKLWNPFDTHVRFICQGKIPSPEEIINQVIGIIE